VLDRPSEGDENQPPPSQRLDTRLLAVKAGCSIAEGGGQVQLLEETLRNKIEGRKRRREEEEKGGEDSGCARQCV
jgi:hypothetical protein